MRSLRNLRWRKSNSDRKPWALEFRSSRFFIITTISLSIFLDVFLYAVIVPVIPFALHNRAGVAPEHSEPRLWICALSSILTTHIAQYWVSILLAVYGAALLAFSPICGWLADRFPTRRIPFLLGLVMLAGSTVFLAVGKSIALLVLGRLLQGFSAAVVWVVGLALVVDTVGQEEVGLAMGYPGIGLSLGILLGPILGGVVFDTAGYEPTFAMCFGLLGVDIVMRLLLIEQKHARKWLPELGHSRPEEVNHEEELQDTKHGESRTQEPQDESQPDADDISRHVAASAEHAETTLQPTPPLTPTPQRRWKSLYLPPVVTLLRSRRLLTSLWASLILATTYSALDSTIPLRVKNVFGWNSLGAGLIFLPLAVPAFFSPLVGYASDRWGNRWFTVAGFLLAGPAIILLRFVTYNSFGQKAVLCVLLFVLGVGLMLPLPPLMSEISSVVEGKEKRAPPGTYGKNGAYAQAYALFNVAWALGTLVGPLWGGMIEQAAGWGTMTWTLGLLSFITAVVAALMVGGWLLGNKEEMRREHDRQHGAQEEVQLP